MLRAKANFGWYHVPRAPSDSAEGLAKFDKRFPVVAFWLILGDTWVATWARMRWITFSDSWTLLKLDFKFHPWFIIKKSDWFPKEFTLNSSKLDASQGVSRGRNSAAFLLFLHGWNVALRVLGRNTSKRTASPCSPLTCWISLRKWTRRTFLSASLTLSVWPQWRREKTEMWRGNLRVFVDISFIWKYEHKEGWLRCDKGGFFSPYAIFSA